MVYRVKSINLLKKKIKKKYIIKKKINKILILSDKNINKLFSIFIIRKAYRLMQIFLNRKIKMIKY